MSCFFYRSIGVPEPMVCRGGEDKGRQRPVLCRPPRSRWSRLMGLGGEETKVAEELVRCCIPLPVLRMTYLVRTLGYYRVL